MGADWTQNRSEVSLEFVASQVCSRTGQLYRPTGSAIFASHVKLETKGLNYKICDVQVAAD